MRDIVAVTDRLKAAMPQMLSEHKALLQALGELGRAGKTENNTTAATRFVEELTAHAQTEEQVLYPAAALVGEYLKLKFASVTPK